MTTEKSAAQVVVTILPPLPELDSLHDIPYARNTPDDWDPDYRSTWQKLQVAERNNMQWRTYAMDLRAALARSQPQGEPVANDYHDAYRGARDDLLDWKNRALKAEESCRKLTAVLNAENGPTFMGEPIAQPFTPLQAPDQAQEAQPLCNSALRSDE